MATIKDFAQAKAKHNKERQQRLVEMIRQGYGYKLLPAGYASKGDADAAGANAKAARDTDKLLGTQTSC